MCYSDVNIASGYCIQNIPFFLQSSWAAEAAFFITLVNDYWFCIVDYHFAVTFMTSTPNSNNVALL